MLKTQLLFKLNGQRFNLLLLLKHLLELPRWSQWVRGKTICIPHFAKTWTSKSLWLALSGSSSPSHPASFRSRLSLVLIDFRHVPP